MMGSVAMVKVFAVKHDISTHAIDAASDLFGYLGIMTPWSEEEEMGFCPI